MEDLTGQVINGFRVTGLHHKQGSRVFWSVICTCGKERNPMREDSILKHTGKCTCKPSKGDVVNGYTYTGEQYLEGRRRYYEVVCPCGHASFKRSDTIPKLQKGLSCPYCRNSYEIIGDLVKMDISTKTHPNTFTWFDVTDLDIVLEYRWYAISDKVATSMYVQCDRGGYQQFLHRHILGREVEGFVVDHQSGCGLDNTRDNMCITNSQGNGRNKPRLCSNTSGQMGVSLLGSGKWRAYITVDNKQISLKTHENFEDAVKARKEAEVFYGFHENHGRESTATKGEQK